MSRRRTSSHFPIFHDRCGHLVTIGKREYTYIHRNYFVSFRFGHRKGPPHDLVDIRLYVPPPDLSSFNGRTNDVTQDTNVTDDRSMDDGRTDFVTRAARRARQEESELLPLSRLTFP